MHYNKGCGGHNPWEGIGCCIWYMQKSHLIQEFCCNTMFKSIHYLYS